jgi:hypothetical protein
MIGMRAGCAQTLVRAMSFPCIVSKGMNIADHPAEPGSGPAARAIWICARW